MINHNSLVLYFLLIILMITNYTFSNDNNQVHKKIGKILSKEFEIDFGYKEIKGIYLIHSLLKDNLTNQLNVRDIILDSETRKVSREKATFSGSYASPKIRILSEEEYYEIVNPIVEYYILNKDLPFKKEINIDNLKLILKVQKQKGTKKSP